MFLVSAIRKFQSFDIDQTYISEVQSLKRLYVTKKIKK